MNEGIMSMIDSIDRKLEPMTDEQIIRLSYPLKDGNDEGVELSFQ